MSPTRVFILSILFLTNFLGKSQNFVRKLKFSTENIREWRIYYSRSNVNDSITNINNPVFAVSGNAGQMKKLGVDSLLNKMFLELRTAKIAKKVSMGSGIHYNGNPERVSIRWKYNDDFNFYRIDIILSEEPNKTEEKFPFVLVSIGSALNDQSVHYVNRKTISKVVETMTYIANKNWGDNYEINP